MKIDLLSKSQLSIINKNNFRYPLAIAEKDYFLAVVLQIIYNSPLKDKLIFKGGTAIHHLYLDQLRFSEDLDFATSEHLTIKDVREVFKPYDFLEIVKFYPSDFALKVERLKFTGPLEQPNSIKIDIDLTQKIILPAIEKEYKNIYGVPVTVKAMDVKEICAEKVRAVNERARYRDIYDLTMVLRNHDIDEKEIIEILKQKELRKPLSKGSIMENIKVTEEARKSGAENLHYREEISEKVIMASFDKLFLYL
jgi:uncharacterized protein